MAFRIEPGVDPGAILAQLQMPADPSVATANALKLRQAQQEQELFPLKKRSAELELQSQEMANRERQIDLQETGIWQQAMAKYGGDFEAARPELAAQLRPKTLAAVDNIYLNHSDKLADIGKKKAESAKISNELSNDEREAFGGIAADVRAANYNPTAMDAALTMLERTHPEYRQHIEALRSQFAENPADIQRLVDGMVTPKARQTQQEVASKQAQQAADEANTALRKAETPGAEAKSAIEVQQANALKSMNDQNWADYIDRVIEDHASPLYRRTMQMVDFYRRQGNLKAADDAVKAAGEQLGRTESAVATAKATAPIKIDVAAATAGARADMAGLTDDDYKRAGEQYARTGVMPAMGRDSVTRGKIVHFGNEWARGEGLSTKDIVTMQAAYSGDKESLKKFQTQRDQIVSFEQTARKNLDLMVEAGKKLADSGSRILNRPLRSINRNLLSTDEQAAFDAAQLIARNEVAKVTSGGGLSGVVSDTARREMEQAMGQDPTISNMIAVANILKKDMQNRHESMDATLSDIRARIGGGGVAPQPAGGDNTPGPKRGDLRTHNGDTYEFDGAVWRKKK